MCKILTLLSAKIIEQFEQNLKPLTYRLKQIESTRARSLIKLT